MNFELIELDPIACESYQTKEVLKILLHSIIFQRALNEHRLCDCESDLLDLSYVRCDSHGVSQRVEEYAEGLSSALERTHFTSKVGKSAGPAPAPVAVAPMKICLAFVERRNRPGAFGLFRGEEKVIWERWHIPLAVTAPGEAVSDLSQPQKAPHGARERSTSESESRQLQRQQLADELRDRLEVILTKASSRKDHIPPVDGLGGGDCSWFEVTSETEAWGGGLGDLMKFARRLGDTIATSGGGTSGALP